MTSADAERKWAGPEAGRSYSDSEASAAFGAARAQNLAASDRFHPGTKTVGALAFDHGRLISTFHERSNIFARKALY
jgi:hypothetical protein